MGKTKIFKIAGFGVVNFLARFIVGGVLFINVKMNPLGFSYGFLLTATALIAAYLLLRFVMKPESVREAVTISLVWVAIALLLDIVTAEPIVRVTVSSLLMEAQTWIRLIVIIAVAPFTVYARQGINNSR